MTQAPRRNVVKIMLFCVAGLQVLTGALLTGGCVCAPSLRMIGFLASACLAAVFAVNVGLGLWADRRPLPAALSAVGVELLLIGFMKLPQLGPPASAWWIQAPVVLLLLTAVIAGRRAAMGQGGKNRGKA